MYTRRRRGGWFSGHLAVSPEAYSLIREYEGELAELHKEWAQPTTFELEEAEAREQRRKELEAAKEIQRKELEDRLSKMDSNDVLREFFAGETHPAPDYVAQMKNDSGLSWSQLRAIYRA